MQRRDLKISVRYTKTEYEAVKKIARAKHLPTTTYIRSKSLEEENNKEFAEKIGVRK